MADGTSAPTPRPHVLWTRLLPSEAGEAYVRAHQAMGGDVQAAIRRAGFTAWAIYRLGEDLVHVVVCDDPRAALARFAADPVGAAWQRAMAAHREKENDGPVTRFPEPIWRLGPAKAGADATPAPPGTNDERT